MNFPLSVGVLCLSFFCNPLLCVHSSFAIILKRTRKLVALQLLSSFLNMDLSITNGIISSKIYMKNDLNFEIVNFPFLDGDVPRAPSYDVYISFFLLDYVQM